MDTLDILALRPQAGTSDEIRTSMERIAAAAAECETMVAAAVTLRISLLLSGSHAAIRAAETTLAEAQINQEQLAALNDSVAALLPIAKKAEQIAHLRASVDNANNLTSAVSGRFRTEYPPIAAALASLQKGEAAAIQTFIQCNQAWLRAADIAREAGVPMPIGIGVLPIGCPKVSFHEAVGHLPGLAGDTKTHDMYLRFWPPAEKPPVARPAAAPDPRRSLPSTNPGREVRMPGTPVPAASAAGYEINWYGEFG
jgi:hypothetical protein